MVRFGSPSAPEGALYVVRGREGVAQAWADICKIGLQLKGIQVTPSIENEILDFVQSKLDEIESEVDAEGVPAKLMPLFEIEKKSKVVGYCKKLELSEDELVLLIHNCHQIGFKHRAKFTEFVPPHLKVLDSDISAMKNESPRQFLKKVHGIFKERKRIHVHLFERGNEWHCFYFSYSDMEAGNRSHWKHGSHLHYISHLWSNLKKRQVWESFDKRVVEIRGSAHIKLQPSSFDPSHRTG
jgi:hypothetical protein